MVQMERDEWLRPAFRGAVGLGLVLLVAACADPADRWHKPGVADAKRAADYADCRDRSRQANSTRIDRVAATPHSGGVLGEPGGNDPDVPTGLDQREAARENASFIACMTDRGYKGE